MRGEERPMPFRTLLLRLLSVHGCSMAEGRRRETGNMFVRRKFD